MVIAANRHAAVLLQMLPDELVFALGGDLVLIDDKKLPIPSASTPQKFLGGLGVLARESLNWMLVPWGIWRTRQEGG